MAKAKFVKVIFTDVEKEYDVLLHVMTLGLDLTWRRRLLSKVGFATRGSILDLACGTGLVTFPLVQSVGATGLVVGLDPSTSMLGAALRKKHASANQCLPEFVRATGEFLPFRDSIFKYTTVGLAFRNFADKSSMLTEARRTLVRSGWFLSLDFVMPRRNLIRRFYVFHIFNILPALGRLVSHNWHRTLVYLAKSIQLSMSPTAMRDLFLQHGFRSASTETITFGVVAILGAQK